MFIKKISFDNFKVLEDISINFEAKQNHNVFPIISANGGGKSTLLQFVFCFLHCAFKENRHIYLKTLLEYYKEPRLKNKLNSIVEFELEHEKNDINLAFFYCKNDDKSLNFNSIITLKELKEKKEFIKNAVNDIDLLNRLEKDLSKSKISTSLVWRELRKFAKDMAEIDFLRRGGINEILQFIHAIRKDLVNSLISDEELNALIIKAEAEKNKLDEELQKEGLRYAFHFNTNSEVLLYKSDSSNEMLSEISDRIYLATPNTQVLHFLDEEQLASLFSNEEYAYGSYQSNIMECQEDVIGLFTYDFSVINLILDAFQKAKDNDFKQALETGKYGNEINATLEELNHLLSDKSITIDSNFKGVSFKTSKTHLTLTPKDLSHGELKKLSIYIWLKAKTADNSVILMDEVDMGLHPIWQYELGNDLQKWSKGSQFILATHSPQIISQAYYKNLVVIKPTTKGATAEQFDEAPLESDLNTIVKTIMGGEYIPKELAKLRKKYRTLFENNQLETTEAKEIKEEMLMYESENSSFFQDIKFQIELTR